MKQIYTTLLTELHKILQDKGVLTLMILAPLAYPLLYGLVYKNETLHNVPIAIVDQSATPASRNLIRSIDATPEIRISEHSLSPAEAQHLYQQRQVHGILIIPEDFQNKTHTARQAHLPLYIDMSSFMYYSTVVSATSRVANEIPPPAGNPTPPFTYTNHTLYNPTGGYASFLLPAILILILHQTLLLSIGMLAGADRENPQPAHHPQNTPGILHSLLGKTLTYLLIYTVMTTYVVGLIPRLFHLPAIGNPLTLTLFLLPFLLSTIFLALTLGTFFKSRENSMMLILFSSIPLLFLSGISWPATAIPQCWKYISWFIPSTHGIAGYVQINTMQANLHQVAPHYLSLWALSGIYFLTSYLFSSIRNCTLHKTQNAKTVKLNDTDENRQIGYHSVCRKFRHTDD